MQKVNLTKENKDDMLHTLVLIEALKNIVGGFKYVTRQEAKKLINNFDQSLATASKAIMTPLKNAYKNPEELETYVDDMAAVSSEILLELQKAPNKKMFLLICKAFNDGLIKLEGSDNDDIRKDDVFEQKELAHEHV